MGVVVVDMGCWGMLGVGVGGGGPFKLHARGSNWMMFNPVRRHGGQLEIQSTNHSSHSYPSMFQFVITGVIGF